MQNSPLMEMLNLLQRPEIAALRKFLQSPYHNSRADVLMLFDYLSQHKQVNLEDGHDRAQVFSAVYPNTAFDSKQLNYVVSFLIKMIEAFVAQKELEASESDFMLFTIRGFRRRHWIQQQARATKAAHKKLEQQHYRSSDYHRHHFLLANEVTRGQGQQGRGLGLDFEQLNEAHEKAFIIEKLQLGCMLQSMQAVATKTYDTTFLQFLLSFLEQHPWLNDIAVAAWWHGYFIQTDRNATDHFEQLKMIMFENGTQFTDIERYDLFLLAVNFSIRRINSGDADFAKNLFDLYREGLSQQVFLENGIITRWSYNNIVSAALKVREIDWAMQFLEDYRHQLEPSFQDTSYYFNLARCRYEKGEYAQALDGLNRMEYDDILQNLSAKTLQLKIYYITNEWQVLDSLIDSVRIYIRRKKVLGYHKENYSNITKFMHRLISIPLHDRSAQLHLKQEIEQCKVLSERGWFLDQLKR